MKKILWWPVLMTVFLLTGCSDDGTVITPVGAVKDDVDTRVENAKQKYTDAKEKYENKWRKMIVQAGKEVKSVVDEINTGASADADAGADAVTEGGN